MPISPLPIPPDDLDPANFPTRAVAWNNHIKGTHRTELNALEANVNVKEVAAAASAVAAASSASGAQAAQTGAANSQAAAAASAASAAASPGTNGTSTTGLTIEFGSKSLTTQTGKAWVVGQTLAIASTASPSNRMVGPITAYNSGTGALTVNIEAVFGSGTLAAWTLSMAAVWNELPARSGQRGKVPVTDGVAVAWDYAQRAAPAPVVRIAAAENLALRSSAVDSSVSPWTLGGSMVRLGQTYGPRGTIDTATVYTTSSGGASVSQAFTGLTPGWYTASVWARLFAGSVPTAGALIIADRDADGAGGSDRNSLGWSGLTDRWQRFEMPFYVAGTTLSIFLAADYANAAAIALADFQLNVGQSAGQYVPTTTAPATGGGVKPTNIWVNTRKLVGSSWVEGSGCTYEEARLVAPDNSTDAVIYRSLDGADRDVAAATFYGSTGNQLTCSVDEEFAVSIWVYPLTTGTFRMRLSDGGASAPAYKNAYFPLVAGTGWQELRAVLRADTSTAVFVVVFGSSGGPIDVGVWAAQCLRRSIPHNYIPTAGSTANGGHADLQYRTVHHVDSTLLALDLMLPPPVPGEWLEVVDVGRAAGTNIIKLVRGTALIAGLDENLDINIPGAAVKLRADIEKGWVLA